MLSIASLVAIAAAAASSVSATPSRLVQRDDIDSTILNYALTLEHLENNFYSSALEKFSESDFATAGLPDWVRRRIVQISQHEASHVQFLSTALGDAATSACEYKFPYTDVKSFIGLAAAIENVGVSAYLGAASKITNPDYLTAAGSILTTEARHQAWIGSAGSVMPKGAPFSGAYDTPLGFSQVYSIAANFITSCPESNPTLPVKAFPAATVNQAEYTAGSTVQLTFPTTGKTEYLMIYSGLNTYPQLIDAQANVYLPELLQGTSYGVITTADKAADVSDENTVAGPIILNFGLSSRAVSSN